MKGQGLKNAQVHVTGVIQERPEKVSEKKVDDKIHLGLMQVPHCNLTLVNIVNVDLQPVYIFNDVLAG